MLDRSSADHFTGRDRLSTLRVAASIGCLTGALRRWVGLPTSARAGGERAAEGDQAGAGDRIGDAHGPNADRAPSGRGAGCEQGHPAEAADADTCDEERRRVGRVRAGRGGEDRAPRRNRGRVGGRGGDRRGERERGDATSPMVSAARRTRKASRSVRAPSASRTAAPSSASDVRSGSIASSDAAPAAPHAAYSASTSAMPAPIESPTVQPPRSVERTRKSDIGPSCSATRKPSPRPTVKACMTAGYPRDCTPASRPG